MPTEDPTAQAAPTGMLGRASAEPSAEDMAEGPTADVTAEEGSPEEDKRTFRMMSALAADFIHEPGTTDRSHGQ